MTPRDGPRPPGHAHDGDRAGPRVATATVGDAAPGAGRAGAPATVGEAAPGWGRDGAPATASAVLPRDFFARPAPQVAHDLIGKILCRPDEGIAARVVEVEAYTQDDPACHAYRGRTERNAVLWGPPGHAYVYRSYGMHWCFNAATGSDGVGQGCLIRAAEPLRGHARLRARRPVARDLDLLRGPAKLCQAFGIGGDLGGSDLCGGGPLHFHDDGSRPAVATGPRVGVTLAADVPWRFSTAGSPWVSAYRRSPRAPRP